MFEVHRLMYRSTLDLRVIKKKKRRKIGVGLTLEHAPADRKRNLQEPVPPPGFASQRRCDPALQNHKPSN